MLHKINKYKTTPYREPIFLPFEFGGDAIKKFQKLLLNGVAIDVAKSCFCKENQTAIENWRERERQKGNTCSTKIDLSGWEMSVIRKGKIDKALLKGREEHDIFKWYLRYKKTIDKKMPKLRGEISRLTSEAKFSKYCVDRLEDVPEIKLDGTNVLYMIYFLKTKEAVVYADKPEWREEAQKICKNKGYKIIEKTDIVGEDDEF